MKVLYILALSIIIVAAQRHPLENPDKKYRFFIMAPHTPEQCRKSMEDLRASDKIQLSNFDFGCNYNDHTFYGYAEGYSESEVRNALPLTLQTNAKIKRVDKLSAAEIEKLHIGSK
jgi:hypothetical protein